MIRRINIFGGPGCGKSTAASAVFTNLKCDGYNTELIQEYVKTWAYEGRDIKPFDQLYLFSKQLRKEAVLLHDNRVQLVVTDSPLMMSVCYSTLVDKSLSTHLQGLANEFEKTYEPLNIVLGREGCEYRLDGRYQNYDEAVKMDELIRNYLDRNKVAYTEIPFYAHSQIVQLVKGSLEDAE